MRSIKVLISSFALSSVVFSLNAFAHDGVHDHDEVLYNWKNQVTNQVIKGSFLTFNNNKVYLEQHNGKIISIPIKQLSKESYALAKLKIDQIEKINANYSFFTNQHQLNQNTSTLLINLLILSLIMLAGFYYYKKQTFRPLATMLLAPITLCIACNTPLPQKETVKTGANDQVKPVVTSTPEAIKNETTPNTGLKSDANVLISAFEPFKDNVKTRQDNNYFYVESNGIPTHQIMVGITSWQQQVPLPQNYTGDNAWSIPLNPVLSDNPVSTKNNFYRGAIAVAVNGIPIFNALNNRGDDALLSGELDKWGGHCGRADDYHYHIAPMHLESIVGKNKPLAYALDGFPIYGSLEPDGSAMKTLDENNGHFGTNGVYHYHGVSTYPYTVGRMRGVVKSDGEQIIPQSRTTPIRDFLQPLRGAVISDFKTTGNNSYSLEYTINSSKYYVNYQWSDQEVKFDFVDASGNKTAQTYQTHKEGRK